MTRSRWRTRGDSQERERTHTHAFDRDSVGTMEPVGKRLSRERRKLRRLTLRLPKRREGGEIALRCARGPSYLVAIRALALRALPIPGTSALTAFAKVRNIPTDPASRRLRCFAAAPLAACANRNSGPTPGPYSCRTYAAISANRRGFMRSSITALPYIAIMLWFS